MKYLYLLLLLVPVAIALDLLGGGQTAIFLTSAGALIPISALIGKATEELAVHTGPQVGGLLNVTLGNAAELIIGTVAIRQGLLDLVKASISGSILGNILLVLGASLLVGGIAHGRQTFNAHIAGMSSTMMTLAVVALIIPGLFSTGSHQVTARGAGYLSIGVAIVLLVLYGLYIFYTVFLLRGTAPEGPTMGEEEKAEWSLAFALAMLVVSGIGAVVMSELLVRAIEPVVKSWGVTEFFIGVILVPIIGNAAEHWSAVSAAWKDQMDLALGIALGSSLQVALFVGPAMVFISLILGNSMHLVFNFYELTALAGAVALATFIAYDGESNWVEGAELLAVYLIVGMGFFFLT